MVRYYGHYSNVARGKRKKQDEDGLIPHILEPDGSSKEYRKNWARLIQKICEVDPLTCEQCGERMKILSFIEDPEIIKKILKHLDLWDLKARPPPKANPPHQPGEHRIDYSLRVVGPYGPEADSQLHPSDEDLCVDLEYPEAF